MIRDVPIPPRLGFAPAGSTGGADLPQAGDVTDCYADGACYRDGLNVAPSYPLGMDPATIHWIIAGVVIAALLLASTGEKRHSR